MRGMALTGMALTGMALVAAGVLGLMSADVVAPAHAGRAMPKSYLLAVSRGPALELRVSAPARSGVGIDRWLSCGSVWRWNDVSVGIRCVEPEPRVTLPARGRPASPTRV